MRKGTLTYTVHSDSLGREMLRKGELENYWSFYSKIWNQNYFSHGEEAILEGRDPAFFCVHLPAKHLIVMPGWLALDPVPCTLYSFLHLHCLGTKQPLLPQRTVYDSLCINGTRESLLFYCRLTAESG